MSRTSVDCPFRIWNNELVIRLPPLTFRSSDTFVEDYVRFPSSCLTNRSITSVFIAAMRGDEIVGSPPLHMHHIHIFNVDDPDDFHLFNTHGDFATDDASSYTTEAAPGYCYVPASGGDYIMEALVNNNRLPGDLSSYNASIVARFAFASGACAPMNRAWVHSPRGYNLPWQTYPVPSQSSISWWSAEWPFPAGRILNAYYHTHQRRFRSMYLLHGTMAGHVALETYGIVPLGNASMTLPPSQVKPLSALLSGSSICQAQHSSIEIEKERFDRRSKVGCRQYNLSKGDVITIAVMHDAMWSSKEAVRQHDVLWIEVPSIKPWSTSVPLPPFDVLSSKLKPEYVYDLSDRWTRDVLKT